MPEAHANFHSANGKRSVLIVDDEAINREMLTCFVQDHYDVLTAANGEEAMECVLEYHDTLSLVLLDLIMPTMSGQEVLRRIKASPETRRIPVIVVSADFSQEIDCLDAGASDFIQKPYPEAGVILARMRRTIELSEDRQIIQSTERDPKTGLYNQEFFYSYAEQYDQFHKDVATDAIIVDINHFSMVNERFGRAYADQILRRIADEVRELIQGSGGIVTRSGADVFKVYCPHRDDYKAMLDKISLAASDEHVSSQPIRLRMGVYANTDKSLEVVRRFDRAKMAADSVRDSYMRNIGVYDDSLLKSELFAQRLIDDFPQAIEQHEFVVFFQPKFDIQRDEPILGGAEALVRWRHHELGMVSPGLFIPLFEDNGLVQRLEERDEEHYVWEEAARQICDWKRRLGWSVPVSVNVSRVDMYDSAIVDTLQSILDRYGLDPEDLHLEVTESAYAEDSKQIIEMVGRLRAMGFRIEMDDFGTGYSSLNMLASLPIDVLKMDMRFVRTAFTEESDRGLQMLAVVADIARHLEIPFIAEGVETQDQLDTLRDLGCDTVQGFFYSPPIEADQFEEYLVRGKQMQEETGPTGSVGGAANDVRSADEARASWWERLPAVSLSRAEVVTVVLAILVAVSLIFSSRSTAQRRKDLDAANESYILAQQAATDLEVGSDYLTENVRDFVNTGEITYYNNYFEELEVTKRRDHAVELTFFSHGVAEDELPEQMRGVVLTAEQEAMSPEEKQKAAEELVYGDAYSGYKEQIMGHATACTDALIQSASDLRAQATQARNTTLAVQELCTLALVLIIVGFVFFVVGWVRLPLGRMVDRMRHRETVEPVGAKELRFVSETYNSIFEDNRKKFERLNYRSMHDALTGLFNRKAYDIMRREMDLTCMALLLVDVDKFKSVNDTYGHDVGDMVLVRVAEVLGESFRSTDLVFRLGGDEFVVIMSNVSSSAREAVRQTIEHANVMLQTPIDDLPPISLSVGVAFADRKNPDGDIFKDADTALYRMKEQGRNGCVIY